MAPKQATSIVTNRAFYPGLAGEHGRNVQNCLKAIQESLESHPNFIAVVPAGSHAFGSHSKGSDLDLHFFFHNTPNPQEAAGLANIVSEIALDHGFTVDPDLLSEKNRNFYLHSLASTVEGISRNDYVGLAPFFLPTPHPKMLIARKRILNALAENTPSFATGVWDIIRKEFAEKWVNPLKPESRSNLHKRFGSSFSDPEEFFDHRRKTHGLPRLDEMLERHNIRRPAHWK